MKSDRINKINSRDLPVLPGALEYAAMGLIPGGLYKNRDYIGMICLAADSVERGLADIVFDLQTSGGLLIGLAEKDASALLSELKSKGINEAGIIADVKEASEAKITVI